MDFTSKTNKELINLAEELEVEVTSKKKKPTKDELVAALETFTQEEGNDELVALAAEELGIIEEDDEDESEDQDVVEDEKAKTVKKAPAKTAPADEELEGETYTYVGKGESSPQRIKFMGRVEFVRGRAVEVTDPVVLTKIADNPSFVQGEADKELLEAIDDEGFEIAEANRKIDKQMDANFKRQHGGAGKE